MRVLFPSACEGGTCTHTIFNFTSSCLWGFHLWNMSMVNVILYLDHSTTVSRYKYTSSRSWFSRTLHSCTDMPPLDTYLLGGDYAICRNGSPCRIRALIVWFFLVFNPYYDVPFPFSSTKRNAIFSIHKNLRTEPFLCSSFTTHFRDKWRASDWEVLLSFYTDWESQEPITPTRSCCETLPLAKRLRD